MTRTIKSAYLSQSISIIEIWSLRVYVKIGARVEKYSFETSSHLLFKLILSVIKRKSSGNAPFLSSMRSYVTPDLYSGRTTVVVVQVCKLSHFDGLLINAPSSNLDILTHNKGVDVNSFA